MPHKYIEIEDLVFALPDDFEGSCKDALYLLLNYITKVIKATEESGSDLTSETADTRGILMLQTESGSKISLNYTMYEYNAETKKYDSKPYIGGS